MKAKVGLVVQAVALFVCGVLVSQARAAEGHGAAVVYPVQSRFVDANGVLIYTETIGHGAPLVILHGGPGASHDYFLPYRCFKR
jgi:hypothetical protein